MFVLGYVRGRRDDGLDCDRPLRWVCRDCGGVGAKTCGNHRSALCRPCSGRYLRRVRRVAEAGVEQHAANGWHLYLITKTAPSDQEHRQWSLDERVRGDDRPICGCDRHMAEGLAVWNGSATKRWDNLNRALKRHLPPAPDGSPGFAYFRCVEPQDGKRRGDGVGRMALHHHSLLASRTPVDPVAFQKLALAAGYGCVLDIAPITSPKQAAYYVSKYVTKGVDDRANVPWRVQKVDDQTGELRMVNTRATYRTVGQSKKWGLTIGQVRAALAASARHRAAVAAARLAGLPVDDLAGGLDTTTGTAAAGAGPPEPPAA